MNWKKKVTCKAIHSLAQVGLGGTEKKRSRANHGGGMQWAFRTHAAFATFSPKSSSWKDLKPAFSRANSDHDECCCCEAADGLSKGGSEEDEIPENMAEMPGDRG